MSDIALNERSMVGHPALVRTKGGAQSGSGRHLGDSGDDHIASPSASDLDRWSRSLQRGGDVRWGRVHEVRASIARGTYLTSTRIDEALAQLIDDLDH